MTDAISLIFALIGLIVLWAVYILPSLVAFKRRHRSRATILALNIGMGWTLIFWVICLAWAVGPDVEEKPMRWAKPNGARPAYGGLGVGDGEMD